MLSRHLIAQTQPVANQENVVTWKKYRVTVLAERLFRIERSESLQFRDEATQSVWYRNMPKQSFEVNRSDTVLEIKTASCKLILKEARKDCRISIDDGDFQEIDNGGNLLGTYRTLDFLDGNKKITFPWVACPEDTLEKNGDELVLENGVCSLTGVAVLDDANSLTLTKDGETISQRGVGSDEYVFAFGNDYRGAVKALYMITGAVPFIPRFALGNWWSRYHDYTDKEYLRLLQKFEDHEVPFTVATVDMDWHYSKDMEGDLRIEEKGRNTPFYGGNNGWTGYSWNKRLFPDYQGFLREINNKNLKVTLNLHPAEGVRWFEDMYEEMANVIGVDSATGAHIRFNIADPQFINAYFSVLHKPYEKDGVCFWWIDWQQGTKSDIEGLDPLWSLNHYHYLDNSLNHSTPLILSRYAGVGSHRYPLGFSGDTIISWETLRYLPYFTATASNIGYTWWSHDIGGHMFGTISGELYTRHLQFGVFSPINRLHSSDALVTTKEPWCYGNGTGKIMMEWLRFRHKMLPYLYTCSYRTHKEGLALIEPLYYEWDTPDAYAYDKEYLFGGDFIVAPVTEPLHNGYAKTKVWLPAGTWTDIFTGDEYTVAEDKEYTLYRDLESIPVLAKEGAILPLSADKGNSCKNPERLDVWVFNGNGEFTMYEDDREQDNVAKDSAFFTCFDNRYSQNGDMEKQTLTITSHGDTSVIPPNRQLTLYFKNIEDGTVNVSVNGNSVEATERYADCVAVTLNFQPNTEYTISVSFEKQTLLQKVLARAKRVLLCAEGNNEGKSVSYSLLLKAKNITEYKCQVQYCYLTEEVKQRLLEIF